MSLQVSVATRNAMLDMIETLANNLTVTSTAISGTASAPTLEIRSGAPPATCATADSGTLLANLNSLVTNFMGDAAAGSKALAGTWQDTSADATGTAGHFRLKSSAAAVVAQGTCGQSVPLTTNALTAANGSVLNFAATTGVVAGMNISGTGIVAGSQVVSTTGTTVVMDRISTAGVANAAAITFTYDLTIDNASIVAAQQVTVTAFNIAAANA